MSKNIFSYTIELHNFFTELKENNNKEWFDANRLRYEKEIKNKSKEFLKALGDEFLKNGHPYIADNKLSLFRINRDIRFSKDKNPYKTNLGIYFPFSTNDAVLNREYALGLYLHFEPSNSFVAAGLHNPMPPALKKLRNTLAEDYDIFEKLINDKSFRKHFPDDFSTDPPLKRVAGYPADHPAIEYLKRKDFTYSSKIEDTTFYDFDLVSFTIEKAIAGKDYMKFLYDAVYQQ